MVLTCNHLPAVPSDDGGTWRRISLVEFTSKFCHNPNPENPNEFLIDVDLHKKFEDWKDHFVPLLLEYYVKYRREGLKEPEEVTKCTREYQRANDIIMDFVEQMLEKLPDGTNGSVPVAEAWTEFQKFIKDNVPQMKNTFQKKSFTLAVDRIIGKSTGGRSPAWKGFAFKNNNMFGMTEDALD